jgi:2-octaprenyl-6-methoxyphenol hydroxylase
MTVMTELSLVDRSAEPSEMNAPPIADPVNHAVDDDTVDYDVAIVGGGVVGTLAACLLQDSGLKVALIESARGSVAADRGQAYSINQLSMQIFAGLGIWPAIRPQVEAYRQVRLSDADSPGIVRFSPADLGSDHLRSDRLGAESLGAESLGYVAEHRVLLAELQNRLKRNAAIDWLCPAKVISRSVTPADPTSGHPLLISTLNVELTDQVRPITAKLVIAADGARSPLRQAAGIKTIGWQYWQACVVALIKPEKFHDHIAYERFQTDGPFAILPLPDGICRIVWTAPKAEADRLVQLDRAAFLAALSQRYGDQMGKLELIGEPNVFPVQLSHSQHYVQPGLALIGDAAHCCHPVGGQGINLGIRDAAALAEVITTAHNNGEDFASLAVLQRYERWRQWENIVMLAFTDLLTRTFSHRIGPIVGVRRAGLWLMEDVQPLKSFALKLMLGLLGRVPEIARSAIARSQTRPTVPPVTTVLPVEVPATPPESLSIG